MKFGFIFGSIVAVAVIIGLAKVGEIIADQRKKGKKKKQQHTRYIVTIAMLGAVAVVLMLFEVPLPFLPPFYKIDISELPVLIGAFSMGPVAGVWIEFIKILLNLLIGGTTTVFVGEIANFIIGCSYIVPAAIVYYKKKTKKNAIVGLVLGTGICVVTGCFLNAYLLLPAYSKAFHIELEELIAMGTTVNGAIQNVVTFVIFATAPLNLIKCGIVSILTMLLYKPFQRTIKGLFMK